MSVRRLKYYGLGNAILRVKVEVSSFLLCSYLVQVHRMCSTVKTYIQCLHVGAGSLLKR